YTLFLYTTRFRSLMRSVSYLQVRLVLTQSRGERAQLSGSLSLSLSLSLSPSLRISRVPVSFLISTPVSPCFLLCVCVCVCACVCVCVFLLSRYDFMTPVHFSIA